MKRSITIGIIFAFFAVTAQADRSFNYHLVREISIPGDEGWDYLSFDAKGARIFVSHGSRVQVVDATKGAVVGEIADTPGVHGIALAPELNRGFISAGRSGMVVVFDLKTLARTAEIKVTGDNPDAILYEPKTQRVFTFNGRGRNATAIDAKTNAVLGTIALDAKPEFAQTDGNGEVYVNLEDKHSLAVIDAKALTVRHRWPIDGCEDPSGLALDKAHHRLFSVCSNKVMTVLDATNGKLIDKLPIGAGSDGVVFDPKTGLVFASCGEGVITVVHEESPQKFSVAQTVKTKRGARTIALDEKLHHVYTVTAQFGAQPSSADQPRPRPRIEPNTFALLEVAP